MSESVAVASGQGLSQTERVVDTFVAPSKTFTDILRSTSWWVPFVLSSVLSLCVTFVIDRQVGFDRVVENQIHNSPKQEEAMSSLTPEQRAGRMKGMIAGYRYTSYASPVFILVVSAIGALVLWATFNFGLGTQTTYSQMLCVWMYAWLPKLLSAVLTVVTLYFGANNDAFDLKDPVGTNLGYYFPDAAPWLKTGLGFLDVLGLWVLFLLVIGTAIVAKVSKGKAAAAVVGWWVVVLVVSVGMAAAFN
jgi:Yip1 domain